MKGEVMTNPEGYRDGMPPIPQRLLKLPIERGYPVPWFVAKVDDHYDFRIVDARKFQPAIEQKRCWLCGQALGAYLAFCIGPMCAITRTISEPPSHRECMEWAIRACPFLTQREQARRTANLPEGATAPAGIPITRQPGVAVLWVTKRYRPFNTDDGGLLFKIGDPTAVEWFREGRAATRGEILESIDSGYPLLVEAAQEDGSQAVRALTNARNQALRLLPMEAPHE